MAKTAEELAEEAVATEKLEKDIDDAFDSGYGDGELEVAADPPEEDEDELEEDPEPAAAPAEADGGEEEKDPLEGVPQPILDKLAEIENTANDAKRTANSASGRAQKVLNELNTDEDNTAKPKARAPSMQLMQDALTDNESFKTLEKDWPDHAEALKGAAAVFGTKMDALADEIKTDMRGEADERERNSEIKAAINDKHPGFVPLVQSDDFKNWVFEGGPNLQERGIYDRLLSTQDSRTDEYYSALLEKYPEWAQDRGTLYGTDTAEASISLLDMHAEAHKEPGNEDVDADLLAMQAAKRERLRKNIPATSGRSVTTLSPDKQKEIDDAFDAGFNGDQAASN